MNPEPQPVELVVQKKRSIKTMLVSIGLALGLIVAIGLGVKQCSQKNYWHGRTDKLVADSTRNGNDRVRWRGDSTKLVGVVQTQRNQIDQATKLAADWEVKFNGQIAISDQQVDRLSYQAKQVTLLRELVNNKTLPPTYLDDPGRIAVPDTQILTATTKTANRAALATSSVDSLLKVVATQGTEIERLGVRYNRARGSSLFAQEKLQNLSERKPLFSRSRRKLSQDYANQVREKRETDVSDLERVLNH